jgi:hypothetical protein
VIPGVTHLLHIAEPPAVADGVGGFLARHPASTVSGANASAASP